MNIFSNPINFKIKNQILDVYDGLDALIVNHINKHFNNCFCILRDDIRLDRISKSLKIINPELNILEFPSWDCLPFEMVSPNSKIVGQRVTTLTEMSQLNYSNSIILTTASSVLQKVPPENFFKNSSLSLVINQKISQNLLINFFIQNGYLNSSTVRENSEFSSRGSIIDVFPPGSLLPVRIDFFGDVIETIKYFDPITQLTIREIKKIRFHVGNELVLNSESVENFRKKYRDFFGSASTNDEIYMSISESRSFPGMENYLPLFHSSLKSIFDYLPKSTLIFDKELFPVIAERVEQTKEFYSYRTSLKIDNLHNFLPVNHLYLDDKDFKNIYQKRTVFELYNLTKSSNLEKAIFSSGARPGLEFSSQRALGKNPLNDALQLNSSKNKIVFIANSKGSVNRISSLIKSINNKSIPLINNPFSSNFNYALCEFPITEGFRFNETTLITEQDLFGTRLGRIHKKSKKAEEFLKDVTSLTVGDILVHVDHGLGRYEGLETIKSIGVEHDCLKLSYLGDDKLYLPVENIELVSRYGNESNVVLDKLGGSNWQLRKASAKKKIKEIAGKLIKVAAERNNTCVEAIKVNYEDYQSFCSRFPYNETDDQAIAIKDVENDLISGKLMDRLICGDVGFGKTEIAIRASFIASMNGYQVAIIAPTTLLVNQHYQNFVQRFKEYPVKIKQLSRFIKSSESKIIKEEIKSGEIQIIIGTHSLLSKSIEFNNLFLLIIDEEQHFGVNQKEHIKSLKKNVHVLTLTATPIPRTLQMSLAGIREMSLITTPPVDRLSVRTFVSSWDDMIIKEAIKRERFRGGLIFCVSPRVKDIPHLYNKLIEIMPKIKIATVHGNMSPENIDKSMMDFSEAKVDILLSTNIIESGLDIPTANTLIIHRADMFGLSQLYQMRGRVGRGRHRAYAYLTIKQNDYITENARKRLEVMKKLDSLGAGFSLASYDMDIRGAGNLLGEEQSGHIKEVGIELYQSLLKEAVNSEISSDNNISDIWSPAINIGITTKIPEIFIKDLNVRLSIYRRLSGLKSNKDVEDFSFELIDRFGKLPAQVIALIELIKIKIICKETNISFLEVGKNGIALNFYQNNFSNPEGLITYISNHPKLIQIRPDQSIFIRMDMNKINQRISNIKEVLKIFQNLIY